VFWVTNLNKFSRLLQIRIIFVLFLIFLYLKTHLFRLAVTGKKMNSKKKPEGLLSFSG